MGRAKANLPLVPGHRITFLERLVQLTEGLSTRRAVVSSLPSEKLGVDLPVVNQPHPERGQLDSLLLGWDVYGHGARWVMSCPVDHPYVARSTLESLVSAVQKSPKALMWSPSYRGRGGHPVIFSSGLLSQLRVHRTEGARPVVQALGCKRHRVETLDEGILADTDTPEDYLRFSSRFSVEEG
jgi:CTP:molybdopterin cytidylyltransferase MocA